MNSDWLRTSRLHLALAASLGPIVVFGPSAIARVTGCVVADPGLCSQNYVDPSPQCPDIITADSNIDVATLDEVGLSDSTPVTCEVLVIRSVQQTEGGPCFQLAEKSFALNYNTPSGGPCPE